MFCQWSRKIGFKVWACPWMQLQHIGSHVFSGNLPAIAQLPNASHGGLVDSPVAKIGGSGGKVDMSGFKPNEESIANRAERRRAEAAERRKKRKEAKKTAKAK